MASRMPWRSHTLPNYGTQSQSQSLSQPPQSQPQPQSQPSQIQSQSQRTQSRQATQAGKPSENLEKANWDNAKTAVFIRLCVEEVRAGNRPSTYFNRFGWDNIVRKFREATGHKYNKVQLKNRWDALKKEWSAWLSLLREQTGLGWDHEKQTIDADDDWWDEKCEKNRDWAKFRNKGPLMVEEQELLFSDVVATGADAWTPSSGLLPPHLQDEFDISVEGSHGDFNEVDDELPVQTDDTPQTRTGQISTRRDRSRATSFPTPITQRKCKKVSAADRIAKSFEIMANSVHTDSSSSHSQKYTIQECMNVLGRMEGVVVGSKLWLYATRVLLKPAIREMFLAIGCDAARLLWLQEQMEDDMQRRSPSMNTSDSRSRGHSVHADNASSG